MLALLDTHVFFSSSTLTAATVRCHATDSASGAEEQSTAHSIAFVRRGMFLKHAGRESVVADANQVLFFDPEVPYRVSHPLCCGDECATLTLPRDVLLTILTEAEPHTYERRGPLFSTLAAPCPADAYLDSLRLLRPNTHARAADLSFEEPALRLAARAVQASRGTPPASTVRHSPRTVRAHRDAVATAQTLLAARLAETLTLAELARSVYTTTFHLCRIFRRYAGTSLHAYRLQLRLRAALDRLADGAADLTDLALQLGFVDHSHFTNAFRRAFGLTPSAFRRTASVRSVREMSKSLQV